MRIERWDGATARARAGEVWPVYDAVFGDVADEATWRTRTLEPHSAREGFVLAAALGNDAALVGFAWAYVGERGQWFSERAAEALGDRADAWVGGHLELVELAVLADARGRGLGGLLHDAALADRGPRPGLLATDAGDSPAVRLYERRGWRTLGPLGDDSRLMGLPPPRTR